MSKILKWGAGITVSVLLLLALIGYIAGPQKSTQTSQTAADSRSQNNLEQLNSMLQKSNVSLCEVYQWIGEMEESTRKSIEAKNPTMPIAEKTERLEGFRDLLWKEYCSKNNLPDSIRTYVNVYGFKECK